MKGTTRLLNKLKLLNVALTGNPANQSCKIQNVFMKTLEEEKGDIMTEEIKAEPVVAPVEVKAEELKPKTEDRKSDKAQDGKK